MISILAFIIVIFGSMNWLSIGFFQFDLVAGLFGYQGSIFSRIIYIIIGICAIYLIFIIIKNKGRLTVKKLKKEEQAMVDKITKKDKETIAQDEKIAQKVKEESENHHKESPEQKETKKTESQHVETLEPSQSYFEQETEMEKRE